MTVIQFTSSAGLYGRHFPLDTVANVVDLWTWTGEFVAACTRLGNMPILYQSYGLPGGPERGKKYQGKKFHVDLTIKPIPAGVLGREDLDEVEQMLAKIGDTQMPKISQAATWWGRATSATLLVTGHMFPRHAQDPRSPCSATLVAVPAWRIRNCLMLATLRNLSFVSAISSRRGGSWIRSKQPVSSWPIATFSRATCPKPPATSSAITAVAPGRRLRHDPRLRRADSARQRSNPSRNSLDYRFVTRTLNPGRR